MINNHNSEYKLLFNDGSDLQKAYRESVSSVCIDQITCSRCHKTGCFHLIPNYYSRFLFNSIDDYTSSNTVVITGIRCSCGHTEALLPDFICPFCYFSYPFICEVISYYFGDGQKNKAATARHFSLAYAEVRRIVKTYQKHQALLENTELSEDETSSSDASGTIHPLFTAERFFSILRKFAARFRFPFLSREKGRLCRYHRYVFFPGPLTPIPLGDVQ